MFYEVDGRRPEFSGTGQFVADNATVIGAVKLAANSSVWFEAILRGDNDDLIVGENTNVQDGAVLHTDAGIKLTIGRDCTVGHRVVLHGCTIGDNCLIGIGSVIMNRAVIGKNSIVGAGSLVPEGKCFPDGVLLLGSPAKVVRQLSEHEIRFIGHSAQHYVQNAERYGKSLRPLDRVTLVESSATASCQ